MPEHSDIDDKVVAVIGRRAPKPSLAALAEDLWLGKSENPSPKRAPALATFYPLQFMESRTLILAFHRWMEIAGSDGVFVEGEHGCSDDLPDREPEIFAEFSTLVAVDRNLSPSQWPFLALGPGHKELREQKIIGKRVGGYPDPELQRVINQSYLDQVARGEPSVCRISGESLRGLNVFDRLWLPIADQDSRIVRFVTVVEPLSRILGAKSA